MQYRTLGKTGWNISAVSMGCWGIGGQWGPVEEKQALDTINAALDAGVNLLIPQMLRFGVRGNLTP